MDLVLSDIVELSEGENGGGCVVYERLGACHCPCRFPEVRLSAVSQFSGKRSFQLSSSWGGGRDGTFVKFG